MLETCLGTKLDLPFPAAPISPDLFVKSYGRTGVVTTQALWGVPSIDFQVPIPIYTPDGTVSYLVKTCPIREIHVKTAYRSHSRDGAVERLQREAEMAEAVLRAGIPWAVPLKNQDGRHNIIDRNGNDQILKILENEEYFGEFREDLPTDERLRLMEEDIRAGIATSITLMRSGFAQLSAAGLSHGPNPWYWNDQTACNLFPIGGPGFISSPFRRTIDLFRFPNYRRADTGLPVIADAEHVVRAANPFDYFEVTRPGYLSSIQTHNCLPFGHVVIEFLSLIGVNGIENHFSTEKIAKLERLALERFHLGFLGTVMPTGLWEQLSSPIQTGIGEFESAFKNRSGFEISGIMPFAFSRATKAFTYAVRDKYREGVRRL